MEIYKVDDNPVWQPHKGVPPYMYKNGEWQPCSKDILNDAQKVTPEEFVKAIWDCDGYEYTQKQVERYAGTNTYIYENQVPVWEPMDNSRPHIYQGGGGWQWAQNRSRVLEGSIAVDEKKFVKKIKEYDNDLRTALTDKKQRPAQSEE